MDVPPCVIWYARDPHGILAAPAESTEEELAGLPAGPHNAGRRAELARVLERYRRLAAAASRPAAPPNP